MKKGQLFSLDFMFSFGIFLTILFITIAIWHNLNLQIEQYDRYSNLEDRVIMASNLLVKTGGMPEDWEELDLPEEAGQIGHLGLAERENVLSTQKISAFMGLDAEDANSLLGISGYNFCIELSNSSGQILSIGGREIRCSIPAGIDEVHSMSRGVVIDGEGARRPALLKVAMWGYS